MMNPRNRMPDVVKLRTDVCKDFLKMIIKPNWRQPLYQIAKDSVENNKHRSAYISAYGKMREKGINNYSIDDMDVTFIYQIVRYCKRLVVKPQDDTLRALQRVKNDRNDTNHSSENEEMEELYLRALISLIDLRYLVKKVDENETHIDDSKRMAYRQNYTEEIDRLKALLDQERIDLVQKEKEIEKDIDRIKNSKDPEGAFSKLIKAYTDRSCLDKSFNDLWLFAAMASEAGIGGAHVYALNYYCNVGEVLKAISTFTLFVEDECKIGNIRGGYVIDVLNRESKRLSNEDRKVFLEGGVKVLNDRGVGAILTDTGVFLK